MTNERILLALSDAETSEFLDREVLTPLGYKVERVSTWKAMETAIWNNFPDLVLLSETLEGGDSIELAKDWLDRHPLLPIILIFDSCSEARITRALRLGFNDYLLTPIQSNRVRLAIHRALKRHQRLKAQIMRAEEQNIPSSRLLANDLEKTQRLGQRLTSLSDLDTIMAVIIHAAKDLTDAESGSLMLLDENTGELFLRARGNLEGDAIKMLHQRVRDAAVNEVLRSSESLLVGGKTQSTTPAEPVYTRVDLPIIIYNRVIGVLEVDNRKSGKPFFKRHIFLLSTLADYAATAIGNAYPLSHLEAEQSQLKSILTNIEEGVIVIDHDKRLLLMNRKARAMFGVNEKQLIGKRIREVISHPELLEVLQEEQLLSPTRIEITLEDGRVLNALSTPIPEVGLVVNLQDITYLKELDRIKSDFVHTVSHDIRSPLTAILGYVELIDRVGPVNKKQGEFIRRIQISVQNITALINDLLELGRIEAGFDIRKEIISLSEIILNAIEGLKVRAAEKSLQLSADVPNDLPYVLGNPVRLRQMLSNLLMNAIIYTPAGGKIRAYSRSEDGQIILQVIDNGIGIPAADQPYIFDKFYRASNVSADFPGTGLGLAIVKSIVDNHMGRIWVDSTLGKGTTFTIVLPVVDKEL